MIAVLLFESNLLIIYFIPYFQKKCPNSQVRLIKLKLRKLEFFKIKIIYLITKN